MRTLILLPLLATALLVSTCNTVSGIGGTRQGHAGERSGNNRSPKCLHGNLTPFSPPPSYPASGR